MNLVSCTKELYSETIVQLFSELYGNDAAVIEKQQKRYEQAVRSFSNFFPLREEIKIYSAPGRTEIGGNHTDHQCGVVLAGAVNLDAVAVVAFHHDGVVRVKSEGYALCEISLGDIKVDSKDDGTASLVKGVISKFNEKTPKRNSMKKE